MKKRHPLFISLILLLTIAIPTGFLVREFQREEASRDLIKAIKADDTKGALDALRSGADPNCRDFSDLPLTFREQLQHLIDWMFRRKANQEDKTRLTALLLTVDCERDHNSLEDNVTLVRALLDAGADPNIADEYGMTALAHSIRSQFPLVSRLLIDRSARNTRALDMAVSFDDLDSLQQMLDAGWDVDALDENGETPLLLALNSGGRLRTDAATMLIDYGANVNFQDNERDTPLILAADGGRYPGTGEDSLDVVKSLLDKGAQVNAHNKSGESPLIRASERLRPVIVHELLQHGASVLDDGTTALDQVNDSPFFGAAAEMQENQKEVIHLLRQAGAKTSAELDAQAAAARKN